MVRLFFVLNTQAVSIALVIVVSFSATARRELGRLDPDTQRHWGSECVIVCMFGVGGRRRTMCTTCGDLAHSFSPRVDRFIYNARRNTLTVLPGLHHKYLNLQDLVFSLKNSMCRSPYLCLFSPVRVNMQVSLAPPFRTMTTHIQTNKQTPIHTLPLITHNCCEIQEFFFSPAKQNSNKL